MLPDEETINLWVRGEVEPGGGAAGDEFTMSEGPSFPVTANTDGVTGVGDVAGAAAWANTVASIQVQTKALADGDMSLDDIPPADRARFEGYVDFYRYTGELPTFREELDKAALARADERIEQQRPAQVALANYEFLSQVHQQDPETAQAMLNVLENEGVEAFYRRADQWGRYHQVADYLATQEAIENLPPDLELKLAGMLPDEETINLWVRGEVEPGGGAAGDEFTMSEGPSFPVTANTDGVTGVGDVAGAAAWANTVASIQVQTKALADGDMSLDDTPARRPGQVRGLR